jgi:uncharacterized protein (DUF1684 family)
MISRILKNFLIILFLLQIANTGCSKKYKVDHAAYKKGIERWQAKRAEGLKKENGWLSLAGLFWLKEGVNKMGTDSSNTIIFPSKRSPKYAGSIYLKNGELRLKVAKGVEIKVRDSLVSEMKIQSDQSGKAKPTLMDLGSLTFFVIQRSEMLGVRIRDKENPARLNFKGLEYFPVDLKWRFDAKFKPYDPVKIIPIVNVLNQVSNDTCPGAVVFEMDGKSFRLDALKEDKELFIIFHDETAGNETYGMGRFIYTNMPDSNNNVVLDFNKAYNPPCAFTVFATCPTPPEQNYLNFRVEAGEKKYVGSEH